MGWLELQKRRYPVDIYRFASAIGGECHFKLQAISTSLQLSVKRIKQSSYLPSMIQYMYIVVRGKHHDGTKSKC